MQTMKDTKIKWLGEIPDSWQLKKIKYVLQERIEKNNPVRTTYILSLTAKQGVIPYDEKEGGGNKPKEDVSAYRLAYPGDIVMNSMNILSGSVGLSQYFGCVTVLIIDAKYYSHTTQSQFDKHTIHSNNLYQIFTYVKNRSYQFGEEKNTVSGMLLYAKTEEEIQPDNVYQMHGSQISVKTLDLNQSFAEIANQMDRIVESHFSGLTKTY